MTPLGEHQLLVFWVQLAILVGVARGLGGVMRRLGQPAVVGELAAGLVVGPSLLGNVAPGLYAWLFPDDPVQTGLLLAVAWVGVALLLVVTGFETDLKLLARLGRSSALVSTGSLLVPLLVGFGLGWILPAVFVGDEGTRLTFAMFVAVALSISALPVVAKILLDMDLMRRNVGQVTVAAGMANDLVGWILLGVIAGIVTGGGLDLAALGTAVGGIALFLLAAFTVGQRLTDAALRQARKAAEGGMLSAFTVVVLVALGAGAITQALGVEAVLGAFVAGIVLGRSRYQRDDVRHALETVTNGFFAPVFFATAGLFVDLRLLLDPEAVFWAVVVIAVAALTKLVGSAVGGLLGGMPGSEALAVGIGLNARGALEIVVATIGLGLGVLNQTSYSIVVVMAMATSMMAPPLLRRALARVTASPTEAARLQREEVLERSVIASTRQALLPTRGGSNSLLAARLLDLSLQPEASVTIYTVHGEDDAEQIERSEIAARDVRASFQRHTTKRVDRTATDPAGAICSEARLGYGLVALGMTEDFSSDHEVSPVLRRVLANCPVPMLLVRHSSALDPHTERLAISRILVPAVGTKIGQAAQEVAYTLADRVGADVQAVHIVNRPDRGGSTIVEVAAMPEGVPDLLREAEELGSQFGRTVSTIVRSGESVGRELVAVADELGSDVIVLSAQVRSLAGRPFLGHGIEYVLDHASETVVVLVFPAHTPNER